MVDIDRLEQLAKRAIPGPYIAHDTIIMAPDSDLLLPQNYEDAEYFAALSPEVVLELIQNMRNMMNENVMFIALVESELYIMRLEAEVENLKRMIK